MADAIYRTVIGSVEFPPDERDANGQQVRDVTVQVAGSDGVKIRVTVWPEFRDVDITTGDFIIASGKFKVNVKGDKTYLNLSANKLAVLPGAGSQSSVTNALDDDDADYSF